MLEQHPDGDRARQRIAQAGSEPRHEQAVAAGQEEIAVAAEGVEAEVQRVGPVARQRAFHAGRRRLTGRARLACRRVVRHRVRQALAIDLAVGGQWQLRDAGQVGRDHITRQPFGQVPAHVRQIDRAGRRVRPGEKDLLADECHRAVGRRKRAAAIEPACLQRLFPCLSG